LWVRKPHNGARPSGPKEYLRPIYPIMSVYPVQLWEGSLSIAVYIGMLFFVVDASFVGLYKRPWIFLIASVEHKKQHCHNFAHLTIRIH